MASSKKKLSPRFGSQEKTFEFFSAAYRDKSLFDKNDVIKKTGLEKSSVDAYWTKQFEAFLVPVGDKFRVSGNFTRYARWDQYRELVSQKRSKPATYEGGDARRVVVMEFYLPLRNESALRETLDSLFYRDTMLGQLKSLDQTELTKNYDRAESQSDDEYWDSCCDWLGSKFVGYSISHVAGRFRAGDLLAREQALDVIKGGGKYIIDETTAVTRFIFPLDANDKEERIRWFFHNLFMRSVLEVINGEDEVWALESGIRDRVYIWTLKKAVP